MNIRHSLPMSRHDELDAVPHLKRDTRYMYADNKHSLILVKRSATDIYIYI